MGIFEVEGQDYWSDPFKASSQVLRSFVPKRRFGVFLDAPEDVDLARSARVPVLVLWCEEERTSAVIDPYTMGHLICVRLEDRRLERCALLELPDSMGLFDDAPAPVARSDSPRGLMDQTDGAQLALLNETGTFILTAFVFDRLSNRVQVRTHRAPTGYQDEAVATFIDRHRRSPPPPRPVEGPEQDFMRAQQSPQLPDDRAAIAIDVERVVLHEEGAHAYLHGAVRLPVQAREIVPPPSLEDTDDGRPKPAAILTVHLAVTNSQSGEAQLIPLRVPCFAEAPLALGKTATGYFRYDLFTHPAIAGRAQTNVIYAFAGEAMSGPHRMAVVTVEMLEAD